MREGKRHRKSEVNSGQAQGAGLTENLQTFFDTVSDFLFVLDLGGAIRHVNRTVLERLGYKFGELQGRSVLDVHPPDRRDEAARIVAEMLAGRREYCPVPLMTRSGGLISVETRVSPGRWDGEAALFGVSKDITELKLSEEKFSRAFHGNAALMAISTLDSGRFIDVNQAFLDKTGYCRDEVIGRSSLELDLFVDPRDREQALDLFMRTGSVRDLEVPVRAKGGTLLEGLFCIDEIIVGPDRCWLTVMIDVTDRKKYERQLQRISVIQNALMQLATEFVNVPVTSQGDAMDRALATMGQLIEADRAYLFMYDWPQGLMSNTHEWCASGISSEIANLQAIPTALFPEWMDAHRAGEMVHIPAVSELDGKSALRAALVPQGIKSLLTLPLMDGECCLGFVGFDAVHAERAWTQQDIGLLRILAELFTNFEVRRRVESDLARLNDEKAMLLDTMDAQVWYLTGLETYGTVNRAHADFLGRKKTELEFHCLGDFLSAAEAAVCREGNRQVYDFADTVKSTEWLADASGGQRLLAISKTPKIGPYGQIEYVVCVAHDITELHELQQDLAAARDEAEAAGRAKAMFLANMSHEIRTPLNAILGYAQIMDRACGTCEHKGRALTTIMSSGEHLLTMMDDILTVVRVDAGYLPLKETVFEPRRMLAELMTMAGGRLLGKPIKMETACADLVPPYLFADKGKIAQVLLNLLNNAIKFTERGGISVEMNVFNRVADSAGDLLSLEIIVSDTGCGIEPSSLERIFAVFEQSAPGYSVANGSGLGLALCRQYAKALGGMVTVDSEEGKGSRFRFTFQARPGMAGVECAVEQKSMMIGTIAPDQVPPVVMVVDDDSSNRLMLAAMLEDAGFVVETAESGREALRRLQERGEFDLVLLDKRMPGLDGMATLRQIRRLPGGAEIRVLMITASGIEGDTGRGMLSAGADGYVLKPFRRNELLVEIKRLLGVVYQYDELPEETESLSAKMPSDIGWVALPPPIVAELLDAVRRGDIRNLRRVVEQLMGEKHDAAPALRAMIEAYDYEGLLQFLTDSPGGLMGEERE